MISVALRRWQGSACLAFGQRSRVDGSLTQATRRAAISADTFTRIGGIAGKSTDSKHSREIDVFASGWGICQSGTAHVGRGSGARKVSVQDLLFKKYVDAATNELIRGDVVSRAGEHMCSGTLAASRGLCVPTVLVERSTSLGTNAVKPPFGEDRSWPVLPVCRRCQNLPVLGWPVMANVSHWTAPWTHGPRPRTVCRQDESKRPLNRKPVAHQHQ